MVLISEHIDDLINKVYYLIMRHALVCLGG